MIRTIFTVANNIAKKVRYSPTAIIEGREQNHLQARVELQEEYEVTRAAQQQAFLAQQANTTCPFEKEKQQIAFEFADQRSKLSFHEAWCKIDEVEQKQASQIWQNFREHK